MSSLAPRFSPNAGQQCSRAHLLAGANAALVAKVWSLRVHLANDARGMDVPLGGHGRGGDIHSSELHVQSDWRLVHGQQQRTSGRALARIRRMVSTLVVGVARSLLASRISCAPPSPPRRGRSALRLQRNLALGLLGAHGLAQRTRVRGDEKRGGARVAAVDLRAQERERFRGTLHALACAPRSWWPSALSALTSLRVRGDPPDTRTYKDARTRPLEAGQTIFSRATMSRGGLLLLVLVAAPALCWGALAVSLPSSRVDCDAAAAAAAGQGAHDDADEVRLCACLQR
jgi:hypothetical protein